MAEFKFFCPRCGKPIQCDTSYCSLQINCPACQQPITVPQASDTATGPSVQTKHSPAAQTPNTAKPKTLFIAATIVILLAIIALTTWFFISNKQPPEIPREGLAAFWPADGSTKDIAGGHNCVLLNGARFSDKSFDLNNTKGIHGGQYSDVFPPPAFDGGACVQVPQSDAWAFGKRDFTIELWANFNSIPVYDIGHAQGGVFISNDEGPYNVNKWWFALGGGVLNFHINDPNLGPVFLVQATFRPKLHQWYHFAITRKNNTFTIYVNGTAVGSETSDRAVPNSNAPLKIGEAEGYYFNGHLAGIGIYQRSLSAAEIKSIFSSGTHK